MKHDCFGFSKGQCTILLEPDCEICKFYATKKEAAFKKAIAQEILRKKGLSPIIKKTDDGFIMSTTNLD